MRIEENEDDGEYEENEEIIRMMRKLFLTFFLVVFVVFVLFVVLFIVLVVFFYIHPFLLKYSIMPRPAAIQSPQIIGYPYGHVSSGI